jgi:hypothetical protein
MIHEIPKNVDELIARLCETGAEEALRCRRSGRPLGQYTSGTPCLLVISCTTARCSSRRSRQPDSLPSADELISQFEESLTDRLCAVLQCAGTKMKTLELCEADFAAYLLSGLDLAREVGVLRGRKELAGEAEFEGETRGPR